MSDDKAASDKPCGSCPWLRSNQTREAIANSPRDARGVAWYKPANLRAHWRNVGKDGVIMPCHATDAEAQWYGGKRVAENVEQRFCVGLCVLARREVYAFTGTSWNMKRYLAIIGRRFSLHGLAAWASRLYFGGATFAVGDRVFTMPTITEDNPDVTVPWRDAVHNGVDGRSIS